MSRDMGIITFLLCLLHFLMRFSLVACMCWSRYANKMSLGNNNRKSLLHKFFGAKFRQVFQSKKSSYKDMGYKSFINEDDQRLRTENLGSSVSFFVFSRRLDERAARWNQLPSRIGIPYYD